MAWNPVITNIVTTPTLTSSLASYTLLSKHNTDFALKLDKTSGIATDLKLVGSVSTPDSATPKSYVDSAVSGVSANLSAKADKASPTFTGTVTIPSGVASTSAVNLSQIQLYLPLVGGTVTGQIKSAQTPAAGVDLTNKSYVDNQLATKANITYVDSSISTATSGIAGTYMPLSGGAFTGTVTGPTPDSSSVGGELATTSFVATAISNAIVSLPFSTPEPGVLTLASEESVDAKLELMAPQVGARLMNAQVINEDMEDRTEYIASHYYVRKVVEELVRENVERILAEQTGDK